MRLQQWAPDAGTPGSARQLAYHRTGDDGPVVVLCHGITDSGRCWSRVADHLARHYDVVLPDARGHGLSSDQDSYAFSAHVHDLEQLLEHLGAAPVVLVGHSMAGPHVTAVAARRPELVRAIAVEDPHWPLVPEDPASYDLEGWGATIEKNARRPVAQLSSVSCLVLLLTGDRDVTVTAEVAAAAAAACPTLVEVHLAGAGHSVRRDRFEGYTAALDAFLGRVHGIAA